MGQSTYADEVNALLGIVADGLESDTATGLRFIATGNDIDSLLRVRHREIIEHDAIDTAVVEYASSYGPMAAAT